MTKLNKLTLPVCGMHCRSCEILIESELKKIPRVEKVSVSEKTGVAEVFYSGVALDRAALEQAIVAAGYSVGTAKRLTFISRDLRAYRDFGIAFLIFAGLYFLLRNSSLANLDFLSGSAVTSLPLVFLVGLTAGVSTCMALVGGLTLGFASRFAETHPAATAREKFRPHIFFNLGRIAGYAFFGGLLGLLGSVFQFSSETLGIITLLVAGVMLLLGLQLTELFPRLSKFKFTLPKSIARLFGTREAQVYSHRGAAVGGALTFFLPCGFTQAMQVLAISTGSPVLGALIMATFALGTAPGLLTLGGLTAVLRGAFARFFFKFAGVAVLFFAFVNFTNGLTLAGVDTSFFRSASVNAPAVVGDAAQPANSDNYQTVRMTEDSYGYSPNRFTIKKDVPVRWIVDAKNIYSCASTLLLPAYGIQRNLTSGENVIEFTPTQTGSLAFSCGMGMYTGVFNVVDNSDQSVIPTANAGSLPSSNLRGAGCSISGATGGGCGGRKIARTTDGSGSVRNTGSVGATNSGGNFGGGCPMMRGRNFAQNLMPPTAPPTPAAAPVSNSVPASYQTVHMTESSYGYSPNQFTVKVGVPVRWIVDVQDIYSCASTLVVPSLGIQKQLSAGENVIEFTPTEFGSIPFSCGMGMYTGVFNVQ